MLVLVLFLVGLVRLLLVLLAVGALPLGFLTKLGLCSVVSFFLLVHMPLRLLMSPRRPLVLLGLLLFGLFGPPRCLFANTPCHS